MQVQRSKLVRTLATGLALVVLAPHLTGCVAGNFGATRSVARWNLRYAFIPRALIYIVFIAIPVYPIAVLFDVVLNNTLEFWSNRAIINAKNDWFEKDGYRLHISHFLAPLKMTRITAYDQNGHLHSVTELREGQDKSVQVFIDDQKIAVFSAQSEDRVLVQPDGQKPIRIELPAQLERHLENSSRKAEALAKLHDELKGLTARLSPFKPSEKVASVGH